MNKRILYYLMNQTLIIQYLKILKGDNDISGGVFNKLSFPRFLALSTIKELPFYSPDDVEIVSAIKYKTFFGYNKTFSEMQSRIYFQVKLNGYYFLRNLKNNNTFKFDSLSFTIDLHTALRSFKTMTFGSRLSFDVDCQNEENKLLLQHSSFRLEIRGLGTNAQNFKDNIFNVIKQICLKIKNKSIEEYENYRIGKIIS